LSSRKIAKLLSRGRPARGIAYRRSHRERVRQKWEQIGRRWGRWGGMYGFDDYSDFWHWVCVASENMPTCSNPFCCGNPRRQKHVKNLTWQERRAEISEKEELEVI